MRLGSKPIFGKQLSSSYYCNCCFCCGIKNIYTNTRMPKQRGKSGSTAAAAAAASTIATNPCIDFIYSSIYCWLFSNTCIRNYFASAQIITNVQHFDADFFGSVVFWVQFKFMYLYTHLPSLYVEIIDVLHPS